MGWDLVSKLGNGYRKYRTESGDFRYIDGNGDFAKPQGWNGSLNTYEEKGVFEEGIEDGIEDRIRTNLDSYSKVQDRVINEPMEPYKPPIDKNYALGRGYPITDYPSNKRLDMLEKFMEKYDNHEAYTIGVHTLAVDKDGTIISSGYRYASHQEDFNILAAEFNNIMEELTATLSDYGDLIVTETMFKGMDY